MWSNFCNTIKYLIFIRRVFLLQINSNSTAWIDNFNIELPCLFETNFRTSLANSSLAAAINIIFRYDKFVFQICMSLRKSLQNLYWHIKKWSSIFCIKLFVKSERFFYYYKSQLLTMRLFFTSFAVQNLLFPENFVSSYNFVLI